MAAFIHGRIREIFYFNINVIYFSSQVAMDNLARNSQSPLFTAEYANGELFSF